MIKKSPFEQGVKFNNERPIIIVHFKLTQEPGGQIEP